MILPPFYSIDRKNKNYLYFYKIFLQDFAYRSFKKQAKCVKITPQNAIGEKVTAIFEIFLKRGREYMQNFAEFGEK